MSEINRRDFLKTSVTAGLALTSFKPFEILIPGKTAENDVSKVSLATGNQRAEMTFKALQPFAADIKKAIGNKRIVLKPNNVLIYVPLACTHAETLEGILEFLKSIGKLRNVIIAESTASGSTMEGFDNYGYTKLLSRYPVKLVDLDNEPFEEMYVIDEKDMNPHMIKVSSIITDPDSYIVSVARMKTHISVGATLSLKNVVIGAPIKDKGFTLYNEDKRFSEKAVASKPDAVSYKRFLHGSGYYAINYNMATLARTLHPDLAVIDGFEGMEGNGPTLGTPVDHRICVVSQDWLSADRVGVELMGMDFAKIGYLSYCAKMSMGEADLDKISIVGENIKDHIRTYKLPENIDKQRGWMIPRS